jgi:hypothetical protein
MRTMLGTLIVVAGYVVVYYRLLVRRFYEQQYNVKESTFGALFSFSPYGRLDALGKKYARRYWIAVAILVVCLGAFAAISDYAASGRLPGARD